MAKQKQKMVLNEMVANGGVVEAAVKKVYSKAYARSGKIVKTKSWQDLIENELPDSELVKVNKEGLKAKLVKTAQFEGSITDEKFYPDYTTRHKYLETAYKIKGKIKDENMPTTQQTLIVNNFFTDPKIQEATKAYDELLKQAIANDIKKPLDTIQAQ